MAKPSFKQDRLTPAAYSNVGETLVTESSPKRKISYVVASDMNPRDGIGLETYVDGSIVMEIFRDDTERRTYMTLFSQDVDLEVLEASIEKFKERIDVD